jgi:hypothetical protein
VSHGPYPFPHLSPSTRAAVDEESTRATGQDFEALIRRCRLSAWRPSERHACLRALVEVALAASAPPDESEDEGNDTIAEQIVELLNDSIYLPEEDHWVLGDGSVLDIGEGCFEAKAGAVEKREPPVDYDDVPDEG